MPNFDEELRLRIPANMKAHLEQLAEKRAQTISGVARHLLAERLSELARSGEVVALETRPR